MADFTIASLIFVVTLILMKTEKIHRTVSAFVGAMAMVITGLVFKFYSQNQALKSINFEAVTLIFGLMAVAVILKQKGFLHYLIISAVKKTGGNPFKLMFMLAGVTSLISLLLGSGTTILLIAPLTLVFCEILRINPAPFLMVQVILANIGGMLTITGRIPNILVSSAGNFSFLDFPVRFGFIVVIVWFIAYFILLAVFSRHLKKMPVKTEALAELDEKNLLQDEAGLKKILFVLAGMIIFLFIHHLLGFRAMFLIIAGLTGILFVLRLKCLDEILREIDWSNLVALVGIFILAGGLESSGLLKLLAVKLLAVTSSSPLLTSIIILWLAAVLSAVIGEIPLVITLIPVIQHICGQGNIAPSILWTALVLGAGFGANATVSGSQASSLVATISQKTRYHLKPLMWLKAGLPVSLAGCLLGTLFLAVMVILTK